MLRYPIYVRMVQFWMDPLNSSLSKSIIFVKLRGLVVLYSKTATSLLI